MRALWCLSMIAFACQERGPEANSAHAELPVGTPVMDAAMADAPGVAASAASSPGGSGGAEANGETTAQTEGETGEFGRRGDPPGYRGFDAPGGRLPSKRKPPAYASENDPCPQGMIHVRGKRCLAPVQECLGWVDDPGKPNRACGEFHAPTTCTGKRHAMSFCIDRTEYTPEGWSLPLVHVAWGEAYRFCAAMKKRLCTESEWEFACEGPDALPYPYGHERDGARCNHDRDELFTDRGKLIDRRVGAEDRATCTSPFGVLNMVGNVDEWTTRPENPSPRRSVLRGGWWLKGRNRCRASTSSHSEIYSGPQAGFRCCRRARKASVKAN